MNNNAWIATLIICGVVILGGIYVAWHMHDVTPQPAKAQEVDESPVPECKTVVEIGLSDEVLECPNPHGGYCMVYAGYNRGGIWCNDQ